MKAFAPNSSSKSAADAGKKKSAPSEKQKAIDNSPTMLAQQSYVASVFPQAIQRKEAVPPGQVVQMKLKEYGAYRALQAINYYGDPYSGGYVPSSLNKKRKGAPLPVVVGQLTVGDLYFVQYVDPEWTQIKLATTDGSTSYWIETDKDPNDKNNWSPEPEMSKGVVDKWGADNIRWREFVKPPMPVDPDATDIKQGAVGDCWLLACLAALASSDEWTQKLKNSVVDNMDGTVTIKLFKGGQSVIDTNKVVAPKEVIVTKWLPTYIDVQEELIYASTLKGAVTAETDLVNPNANPHIWPALIEKGVATLSDNKFWKLDNKGLEKGFGTMMGGVGMVVYTNDLLDATAWTNILTTIDAGGAGTATAKAQHAEMTASADPADINATVSRMIQGHVYYISAADVAGQKLTLKNPHQTVHPPDFDLATAVKYLTKIVVVPKPA